MNERSVPITTGDDSGNFRGPNSSLLLSRYLFNGLLFTE